MRANPIWLKAPFLLLRWPPILAALGASFTILVVAAGVAPLFLSSAASGALRSELRGLPPAAAGFSLGQETPLVPLPVPGPNGRTRVEPAGLHRLRSQALERALTPLPHLAPPLATVATGESGLSAGGQRQQVQPLARRGFLDHIEIEDSVGGEGAWLARSVAEALKVEPGEVVTLDIDGPAEVRIKGIYSDLAARPVTPFWGPVDRYIHAPTPAAPIPPAPLLMSIPDLLEVGSATRSMSVELWEYGLEAEGLTLDEGRRLGRRLSVLSGRALDQDTALGSVFQQPFLNTTLPLVVDAAAETVTGAQSPVTVLALIGTLVALVLIAVSAHYVVQKRAIEFRLLIARGVGGTWIALRSIAESIVAATFFGCVGAALTLGLIAAFGPGPVDASAVRDALWLVTGSLAIALIVLGVATALAAARRTAVEQTAASHETGFPWEVVLVVAAGACLYLIGRRGALATDGGDAGRVDILLVFFPLLGVAGISMFVLRFGLSYLNRMRAVTHGARFALFLAVRRLAGASRSVMLFVAAAAVSVGMLVYSTGLVSSVRATTHAKTHVFVGSDVGVVVSSGELREIRVPHTVVTTLDADVGERAIEVMGVEPGPFREAAYWDDDFASRGLDSLLAALREGQSASLPVVVAGDPDFAPRAFTVAGHATPVEVVGRADTWPGMRRDTPMLVAEVGALGDAAARAGFSIGAADTTLWAKGPTDAVLAELRRAGIDTQVSVSARDAARSSALLSISWTFGLLRVLGIVAGLLSIVGMVLYVAARHRSRLVAYLLGRRMGLEAKEHRLSLGIELLAMLAVSLVLGTLLGVAAILAVYERLDLLPTVPPAPLFRLPALEVGAAAALFLAAATLGSWVIQRSSDRVRPGEVMRLAD